MYPSHIVARNSAVLKSWLFLSTGQLDESCLHVFYRIDAAEAEMVHRKTLQTSGPIYKTLKTGMVQFACRRGNTKGTPSVAFRRERNATEGIPYRISAGGSVTLV